MMDALEKANTYTSHKFGSMVHVSVFVVGSEIATTFATCSASKHLRP